MSKIVLNLLHDIKNLKIVIVVLRDFFIWFVQKKILGLSRRPPPEGISEQEGIPLYNQFWIDWWIKWFHKDIEKIETDHILTKAQKARRKKELTNELQEEIDNIAEANSWVSLLRHMYAKADFWDIIFILSSTYIILNWDSVLKSWMLLLKAILRGFRLIDFI